MGHAGVAGVRGILFTDVVDSTGLRTRLGEHRADALRRDHDAIFRTVVDDHDGRVLRWTGDGMKADFASASAAVAAAIDLQRAVRRYSRGADAVAPFQVRAGISVGEVVDEDGDVHGVAVIEGARLEAMAAPGEILVSDLVERLGQRRIDATFEPAGTHALKGLDLPVTVLRVVDAGVDGASHPVPRSLAVDQRFPMVGRATDLDRALAAWAAVRGGDAATVLVAGQPGIGKSRFLAQVAEQAHADGALVLAGTCDADLAVPYQPFALAFADLQAADDDLTLAVADGAGPLGPLFPSRRAGRFDDAGPSARFELFEAVVELVDRLAGEQPVVLVLEDLQWATSPTVQLLRHLARNVSGARLLLLCSYRVDDVVTGHPLQELLTDTRGAVGSTRIELGPLELDDVAALVAARAPDAPAERLEAFARRVCDESGGSPFFVCELVDHLSTTGQLDALVTRTDGPALPLPDTVRDVVGQRLGRLGAGAVDLLATAAVVGLSFDLDLVANLAGRTPEDALAILEGVARVAIVREVDAGRFTFAHAIVRSTLLGDYSATRRSLAHRRVAEAIEGLGRPDHDQLAHHWSLGGDQAKAVASLELAADRDLEALAYESAAERYQAVIDHHSRAGDGDVATLARAWLGLGLSRRALGQIDFILAVEEAGRLGRRLRDVDVVVEAAVASVWPGTFFVIAGGTHTGLVELGEDALALVDPDDPRRPRILANLASHLTFDDDRDRRVELLRDALEQARRIGDPELTGSVLVAEHLSLWDPTTAARRAAIGVEVGRMARAAGDVDLEFYAGFFAAISAVERADLVTARAALEALAGPVATSRNFYFGFLADRLSLSIDILCSVPGCRERIDDLAARYEGTHADTFGTMALQTGALSLQAGEMAGLVPLIEALVEGSHIGSTWSAPLAVARVAAGDLAGADALLDAVPEPPLDYFWISSIQTLSLAAAALGRVDLAKHHYDLLLPFRDQLGITASGSLCFGLVSTSLGELALTTGEHTAAIDHLEQAMADADRMGAPYEQTRARRLLAAALLADGRPAAETAPLLAGAAELATTHGFHGELRELEVARTAG